MKKSKKILFKEFKERNKKHLKDFKLYIDSITENKEEELRQFNFEMEQLHYRIRLLKKKGKIKEYTEEEIKKNMENYRIEYEKMYPDKVEFIVFEEFDENNKK